MRKPPFRQGVGGMFRFRPPAPKSGSTAMQPTVQRPARCAPRAVSDGEPYPLASGTITSKPSSSATLASCSSPVTNGPCGRSLASAKAAASCQGHSEKLQFRIYSAPDVQHRP